EGRGDNWIDIGNAPAGFKFTLSAVQVLDSNFATFGVLTGFDGTDKASATAGLSSADNNSTFLPESGEDFGSILGGDLFGKAIGKLVDKYQESQGTAQTKTNNYGDMSASSKISVAGALAFSFTDHHALTHIGGTAVLKSADDMEIRSEVVEHLQLSAEADN